MNQNTLNANLEGLSQHSWLIVFTVVSVASLVGKRWWLLLWFCSVKFALCWLLPFERWHDGKYSLDKSALSMRVDIRKCKSISVEILRSH